MVFKNTTFVKLCKIAKHVMTLEPDIKVVERIQRILTIVTLSYNFVDIKAKIRKLFNIVILFIIF
jgi:hypothetical protein